jgi:predicted dinucleotide-binding enzyme
MRIGIRGSGPMGSRLGTLFARTGHDMVFNDSHNRDTRHQLVENVGGHATVGTPAEAASDADAVLLAVQLDAREGT